MELIEIKPSLISLRFPDSVTAEVTVLNLTLHQLAVRVICTNPDNFIISPSVFRMESFEQVKLHVQVKYYQEALLSNYLGNKILLYCYDQDQEGELWNEQGMSADRLKKIAKTELQLTCTAEMEHHVIVQPKKKQLLLKVHRYVGPSSLSANEKHTLITFLETLGDLKCLHALLDGNFIAQYRQLHNNNIGLLQEITIAEDKFALYAISMVPVIAKPRSVLPEARHPTVEERRIHSQAFEVVLQERSFSPEPNALEQPPKITAVSSTVEHGKAKRPSDLMSTFVGPMSPVKTTFAGSAARKRKRNKSHEAVRNVYNSEDEEEDEQNQLFVDSRFVVLNPPPKKPFKPIEQSKVTSPSQVVLPLEHKKEPSLPKYESVNCITQPISMLVSGSKYFLLFANALVVYDVAGNQRESKMISLQETDTFNDHKFKKVFMKHHGHYVVFGCDYSFNVVDLERARGEWVAVQRKEILDVAIIKEKGLLAVGGKNFSKFSLFGKTTQRSNIKLYGLEGKHDHLLTYDIEGGGVILQLEEVKIEDKQVLVALGELEAVQTLYLLNVLGPTKIEVIGKFDLGNDLALQHIRSMQFSGNGVFGLECMNIDNRDVMVVKCFHLKMSGWKSSIATETCTIKHGAYSFFESDDRFILVYSVSNEELALYDHTHKTCTTMRMAAGFRMLKLRFPYVFLLYDNCIEIRKFENL